MNFGEKKEEYSNKQKSKITVVISQKYVEAKAKAEDLINKKKYNLTEADFWILMNETKTGKMMYSGLIITHNGCLKINEALLPDDRFKPECMSLDKDGYGDSLVYTYCSPEQGIFEVGEVSKGNCKNAYPYAMALKRCMDRVILKSSKIAFYGIYSEAESDEFKQPIEEDAILVCTECGGKISVKEHDWSVNHFKRPLCRSCQLKLQKAHEDKIQR